MENAEALSKVVPEQDHHILALSALFEGEFSIDWIEELTGDRASQILSALEKGVKYGSLTKKKAGIFCFSDPKEKVEWLKYLSPEDRDSRHREIVNLLLSMLADDENKAKVVAHHLLQIQNEGADCRWLVKAGDAHRKCYCADKALQCYAKALEDLSSLDKEDEDSLFVETAIKYSRLSTARENTASVLSLLEEAKKRAKKLRNLGFEARLEMHIAKNKWFLSKFNSSLEHLRRGQTIAKKLEDPELSYWTNNFNTIFLYWQGRFRDAVRAYEETLPSMREFSKGNFLIFATLVAGYCYTQTGQVTRGVDLLESARKECLERGSLYLSAYAGAFTAACMLDARRPDDALPYLKRSMREARREHNKFIEILVNLMMAFYCYIKEETTQCASYLRKYLQDSERVQLVMQPHSYLMELYWGIEQRRLPCVNPGFSFEKELSRILRGKNVFMKGFGYRYQAHLRKQKGLPWEKVNRSLNRSMKYFEESGQRIEFARSQLEVARHLLLLGNTSESEKMIMNAYTILALYNEELIPDDLKALINKSLIPENLLKQTLDLGKRLVSIKGNEDPIEELICDINRIIGAERGAVFLFDGGKYPFKPRLRASVGITEEQIADPNFASSIQMIMEVNEIGKGRILELNMAENPDSNSKDSICSRICVPITIRSHSLGVLYHDNRFLRCFKDLDLELLSYYASLAALVLDNSRADRRFGRFSHNRMNTGFDVVSHDSAGDHFKDIVAESPTMLRVLIQAAEVAKTDTTILILGETGVGKELVTRAIHQQSMRSKGPFIQTDCSTLTESLITSELFGHEKGAFTDAVCRRIGRIELANKGTLFLDEIGDLQKEAQRRLLRVLQSREFERVGGNETLRSDFRLIAATNQHLEEEVNARRFRADLYYRLNVFQIRIPPLRERKEDIPKLAYYFLRLYSKKLDKTFQDINDEEMRMLIQYDWPGNVRELENVIEKATVLSSEPDVSVPELTSSFPVTKLTVGCTLEQNERNHILWAVQKTGWKIRGPGGAAELLDVHPSTLIFRIKKLGIRRPKGVGQKRGRPKKDRRFEKQREALQGVGSKTYRDTGGLLKKE